MWAYGAYEEVWPDQEWDPAIPSLLDRGVVYVHAHVRGGGEGGRRWWLDGRMEHKQHTFDDHIAVADGLGVGRAWSTGPGSSRAALSAGGLLAGAVFTQRPDRWRAVVAEVPFVDVVTTMLDADDPADRGRVGRVGRPLEAGRALVDGPLLAVRQPAAGRGRGPTCSRPGPCTTPGSWCGSPRSGSPRLRETDPEWAPRCLFRVETGAGAHVGPAGRFAHLGYEAEVYAWILDRLLDAY